MGHACGGDAGNGLTSGRARPCSKSAPVPDTTQLRPPGCSARRAACFASISSAGCWTSSPAGWPGRARTTLGLAVADAMHLPLATASVDRAFLVTVLGEVPDPDAALAELRRVLKPGALLGFCESLGDPDIVFLGKLRNLCGRQASRRWNATAIPWGTPLSSALPLSYAGDATRPGKRVAVSTASSATRNIIVKIVPTLVAMPHSAESPAATMAPPSPVPRAIPRTFERLRAADEAPMFSSSASESTVSVNVCQAMPIPRPPIPQPIAAAITGTSE